MEMMKKTHLRVFATALGGAFLWVLGGCNTTMEAAPNVEKESVSEVSSESLVLMEGDVIEIVFPGAQELSSNQKIRRDGKITLTFVGEVDVTGLTSSELEEKLLELYDSQIVTKEVTVTLISSSFPVFVQGVVNAPGEIIFDRRITALEAVMKAGYDPKRANLKKVVVKRLEDGKYKNYSLNLQAVLDGKKDKPFYLKPSDMVIVPEKFVWK